MSVRPGFTRMSACFRIAIFLLLTVATATARDACAVADRLIHRANAWKPGQPIPEELLHTSGPPDGIPPSPPAHQPDGSETIIIAGEPLQNPTDSMEAFGGITNYPLLREIIFATHDVYVSHLAVNEALDTVGSNQFFADVKAICAAHPEYLLASSVRALRRRADEPMAVLLEMITQDTEFSPRQARAIFAGLTADLRAGTPAEQAARRCQPKYPAEGNSSRVGCGGIILLAHPILEEDYLAFDIPALIAWRLLRAHAGDTFIERHQNSTYAQSRVETRYYWVKEAYHPSKTAQPTT